MRNRIAIFFLFLSWPICVVHRYWNNEPIRDVKWIVFDETVSQDFRWYWVYNELWLSSVFVLLAALIWTRRTRAIRLLLWANVLISLIDIVNYWLWFRRNEVMLTLEGLIIFVAAVIIFKHESTTGKSNHEKAT